MLVEVLRVNSQVLVLLELSVAVSLRWTKRIPYIFQGSFFQSVATAKKLKSVTFFTSKMHLVESAVSSLVTAVYSDLGMRSSKTTRMAV